MDSSFPLTQGLCYQQAARLMTRGASLSIALRGCQRDRGSHTSATKSQREYQHPAAAEAIGSA